MEILQPGSYEHVRQLYEGLRFNLVIDSIIDGNTPAWVYADHPDAPQTALMWNRQDALLLGGYPGSPDTNRTLNRRLLTEIIPDARERYVPEMALFFTPGAWDAEVETVLAGLQPAKAARRFYHFGAPQVNWRTELPPGSEMHRIDENLLADRSLANVDSVVGWVRSFWASIRDFTETGFGYCLLVNRSIASWCLTVYASGMQYELGLATVPDYRARGFATLAAAACLDYCVEWDLAPHWHCWEDNPASIAVAEKVGFKSPVTYFVYRFGI